MSVMEMNDLEVIKSSISFLNKTMGVNKGFLIISEDVKDVLEKDYNVNDKCLEDGKDYLVLERVLEGNKKVEIYGTVNEVLSYIQGVMAGIELCK